MGEADTSGCCIEGRFRYRSRVFFGVTARGCECLQSVLRQGCIVGADGLDKRLRWQSRECGQFRDAVRNMQGSALFLQIRIGRPKEMPTRFFPNGVVEHRVRRVCLVVMGNAIRQKDEILSFVDEPPC